MLSSFWRLCTSLAILGLLAWLPSARAGGSYVPMDQDQLISNLVNWVRNQNGGYVSDKLEFDSEEGQVYVSQDIAVNEVLIVLPGTVPIEYKSARIHSHNEQEGDEDEEGGEEGNMCDTAVWLVHEYLVNHSFEKASSADRTGGLGYGPYVDWIFQSDQLHHPAAWSPEAKELMDFFVGGELEPRNLVNYETFDSECAQQGTQLYHYEKDDAEGDKSGRKQQSLDINQLAQPMLERAFQWLLARNWGDEILLPVWDLIPHHNGDEWHNVDFFETNHGAPWAAFSMGAIRFIPAGEALFTSFNQCHHSTFCDEGLARRYMTPEMLYHQGFVEAYPRRFGFLTGYDYDEDEGLVFEVDQVGEDDEEELFVVNWIQGARPNLLQLNYLHAHLLRLRKLKEPVQARLAALTDPEERFLVEEYFDALMTAVEQAFVQGRGEDAVSRSDDLSQQKENLALSLTACLLQARGNIISMQECRRHSAANDGVDTEHFDELQDRPDPLNYAFDIANCNYPFTDTREGKESIQSFYQAMEFEHYYYEEVEQRDTCLALAGIPQSCTSFRPHYHEIFVSYPASFVKKVKRVLFMGGGDLMILHEILKYDSVELVVGMELDQQVARHSFRHYGIQPEFDDPRVHWMFGDASKSLLTIPENYFGTFDLVFIDLLTYVADTVMVAERVSLLDMGMRLLQPNGVLAQNRDFAQREKPTFAKYAIDLLFDDIPMFCHEYMVMASNGVDFVNASPQDHGIDTLFYNFNRSVDYFGAWTNYHHNQDFDRKNYKAIRDPATARSIGLFTVLEAENAGAASGKNSSLVIERLSQALVDSGLSQVNGSSHPTVHNDVFNYTTTFILKEGLVTARIEPSLSYVALDVHLWDAFDQHDTVLKNLVKAVDAEIVSTYSVSTGGMFGPQHGAKKAVQTNPPTNKVELTKVKPTPQANEPNTLDYSTVHQQEFTALIQEMPNLSPRPKQEMIVICGQPSTTCVSLKALHDIPDANVVAFWTCSGITANVQAMVKCEESLRRDLLQSVQGPLVAAKFSGIFIDPEAPREMGQILHKILNSTMDRYNLLGDDFVAIAPTRLDTQSDTSWRGAFMERLRTDMVVYNPVHHITASLVDTNGQSRSMLIDLVSAGDPIFYSRFRLLSEHLQKKLGLGLELQKGDSGVVSYRPDFAPSTLVFNKDYDVEAARAQWWGQRALAQQELLQFELPLLLSPATVGEYVLVNNVAQPFIGEWRPGRVVKQINNETYQVLMMNENPTRKTVVRRYLRRNDTSTSTLTQGQQVLIKLYDKMDQELWRQGYIMENHSHLDGTYRVRIMTLDHDWVMQVSRHDLVPQMEDTLPLEAHRALTSAKLKATLQHGLSRLNVTSPSVDIIDDSAHLGSVLTAAWPRGHLVLTWDGRTHVDLNLFLLDMDEARKTVGELFRRSFQESLGLVMMGWDWMPRGIGRVVNLPTPPSSPDPLWFGTFRPADEDATMKDSSKTLLSSSSVTISKEGDIPGVANDVAHLPASSRS